MPPSPSLRLAGLAALVAAAGCAFGAGREPVHALPAAEREQPVPEGPWTWDVLWPFGHGEARAGERTSGVRPLFRNVTTDRAQRLEVLYPLYRDTREEEARSLVLFPFLWHDALGSGEGRDTDTAVAPLLWWGSEPGQGGYFLLFPLGGTVKQKFLLDEGTFVLFPAYLRTRNGDYRGTHLLWPLIHSGEGGGRSAFRVLPFWSRSDQHGAYRRRALLWPFVHWGDEGLSDPDPRSRWLVWPLVGHEASASGASGAWTVLWPFFQWADGPRATARDLPFPFFRTREVRGEGGSVESSLLWFWPFWGRSRGPEGSSRFLLWPVHMAFDDVRGARRTASTYVNPFWLRVERGPVDGPPEEIAWRFWPLVSGTERADGSLEWSALAPLPFVRWPELEANWGVFWELLRRRRAADGSTATDALFSLVRHRAGPAGWRFRIPGLFAVGGSPAGSVSWRAVEGLVGVDADRSGSSTLRLLWFLRIPFPGGGTP